MSERKKRPYNLDRLSKGSTAHHVGCERSDRRSVVAFDDETFEQIRQFAINNKTSFAGAVRLLVEFGLIDANK